MSKRTTGNVARRSIDKPGVSTPEREARLRRLEALPDEAIDVSDIPEISDNAEWALAEPLGSGAKRLVSIRLDESVIDYFKSGGAGYQTRINAVLRQYMRAHARTK